MDRDATPEIVHYRALQRWIKGKKPPARGRTRRRDEPSPREDREYYEIVCHYDLEALITEVNRMCAGGWVPLGGVVVLHGDRSLTPTIYYLQTLVAETEAEETETLSP
jgi:hypothetical protein